MRLILDCENPDDFEYALHVGKRSLSLETKGPCGYWSSENPTRYASVHTNKCSISVTVRHTQVLE